MFLVQKVVLHMCVLRKFQKCTYLGAKLSNSSKNMIHGLAASARSNTLRTPASLSPMYLDNNSGPYKDR